MSIKWKQIGGFAIAAFLFVAVQSQAAQEDRAAEGQKLYERPLRHLPYGKTRQDDGPARGRSGRQDEQGEKSDSAAQ